MPKITLLAWNLLNFGESKYRLNKGRVECLNLIAQVVHNNNADVAGFTEILSNKADPIGKDLVAALNLLDATKNWTHKPSEQFLTGTGKAKRKEQYLYLWNKNRIDTYTPTTGNSFQYKFENPVGTVLKFPGAPPNKGRPPWLGFFQTKDGSNPKIVVAIMHSPGPDNNPEAAAQEMAKINELTNEGNYTVIMGDFNIRANSSGNVSMNDVASNGYVAFHALDAHFTQYLDVRQSSLVGDALIEMRIDECYSNPYDQVFVRPKLPAPPSSPTPIPPATQFADADMDELIENCVGPVTGLPQKVDPTTLAIERFARQAIPGAGYLSTFLGALQGKAEGTAAPTQYTEIEDGFYQFRKRVSDHAPILADIIYL